MNTIRRPTFASVLAALVTSFAAFSACSQTALPSAAPDPGAASAPAPIASAPLGPRLRSPAETGKRAQTPGDLRPERPVTPQISIPFGKKAAPTTPGETRIVRPGNPTTAGGVDDAAARCESQADLQDRAACRARLAREAKGKLPN